MKKIILALLVLLQTTCNLNKINCLNICTPTIEAENSIISNFKPDFYITEQTPQDLDLLKSMKDLFYEPDPVIAAKLIKDGQECNTERVIYNKTIDKYNAQEIILRTKDGFRLSSLYFKNPNALCNIIYVTGYFADETPTGKWATPFWPLHTTEIENSPTLPLNMLVFDWRSFGFSEGHNGFLKKDFGSNAYFDIQAAVDFVRKDNDLPIVLVGFCAGAAMVMKATVEAQKKGYNIADALVLNSIFTTFEDQLKRASLAANQLSQKLILKSGIVNVLDKTLNGSLFELKPIEMIEEIKIPCLFEHYKGDPFALLEGAIEVYNKAKKTDKFVQFLLSDEGRHVRIHSKVPFQYRNFFHKFLLQCGILQKLNLDKSENLQIENNLLYDNINNQPLAQYEI